MKQEMPVTPTLNKKKLQTAIHDALRSWHDVGGSEDTFLAFLLIIQQARWAKSGVITPVLKRQITNQVLKNCLDELAKHNEKDADILHSHFVEGKTLTELSLRHHQTEDTLNKRQAKAILALTDILFAHESNIRHLYRTNLEKHLPVAFKNKLFGISVTYQTLIEEILSPDSNWIMVLSGLGGIGKSALAYALVDGVIDSFYFDNVIWLTINNCLTESETGSHDQVYIQLITALGQQLDLPITNLEQLNTNIYERLKNRPHLIVIDNLEIPEHLTYILGKIAGFAEPTKFILTSRAYPAHSGFTRHHFLTELNLTDVIALLNACTRNGVELSEVEAREIYNVVGGNPYALRLVANLIGLLPLQYILQDLAKANSRHSEDMFRYIYWMAWRTLSEPARRLLQVMPLIVDSASLAQIQAVSELAESTLPSAILELINCSLLLPKGNSQQIRYGIHRLTETFLRTEIIHWPEDK